MIGGIEMRISMVIPDDLLKVIDCEAEKLHINRTAFIIMSVNQQINQNMLCNNLPELIERMYQLEAWQKEYDKKNEDAKT